MKEGLMFLPKNKKRMVIGNRFVDVRILKSMSYRKMFLLACYDKLWPDKAEVITEPTGKCFSKIYRHCLL